MEFTVDEMRVMMRALSKFARTAVQEQDEKVADDLFYRIDKERDRMIMREDVNFNEEIESDPEYQEWKKEVEENLVPRMQQSAVCVSLAPRGETDAKFAIELGMMIMMDKPIILVKEPGQVVPAKLLAVADEVVEVDWSDKAQTATAQQKMAEAMDRMTGDK